VFDLLSYGIRSVTSIEFLHMYILQIAPVIHEWTYDAMCHDLLNMEGNKYVYEVGFLFSYEA
jgi:hypothetical protein